MNLLVPDLDPSRDDMILLVPDLDPLILESVFLAPGRNDPCSCMSGTKYKRCCLPKDEAAWRVVAAKSREADVVLERMRGLPKSIYPEYDPI